jgi:rubrerythrin
MGTHGAEFEQALTGAIYKEIGARNFYERIAKRISNPEGREKFTQLSRDEEGHREKLTNWYERMFERDFPVSEEEVRASEIKEFQIDESSGALKALDIAIVAESEANRFYREQADQVEDEELRRLFSQLAAEEQGHYNLLQAERNALIGGFYWFDMDSTSFLED